MPETYSAIHKITTTKKKWRKKMKSMRRIRCEQFLFAMALLPLTQVPALAAEQADAQAVEDMVVTASRTEERSIDVPITTEVITRDQIEMSGVNDIGDLIGKYITGHYHKYSGLLSPVGLRGFRTDAHGADLNGYVLLLIDGHRVGTGNAAKLNLDRIEKVEVIKGPSSALYGSAAMGGVINLITKKGDGELGGSVGGEIGSYDYYQGQASMGGEVNDKVRFFASVSGETMDDYETVDYGTAYNSGVEKLNIGGNLVYTLNDQHEFRLGGNYSNLTSESPDWAEGTYSYYDSTTEQDNDKSTGYADLEYNGDYLNGQLHWKAVFYYLWDKNLWNYGTEDPESLQTKYIDTTLGTDHQFTWKMNSWNTLLAGFTLDSLEKESSSVVNYEPSTPYTPNLDYDNQAVFLQDSMDLLDNRLNILAAVRYDRFDVTTERAETGSYTEFNEQSEDYSHISPKIGAGMKFMDEMLRVRANIGEGFKSPTASQLSADYYHSSTGVHYLGNPDLDPETSITYDVGFDVYLDGFTFKADYFTTDYEDKITSETYDDNGVSTTTYVNHGDAVIAGFEFSLEWAFSETFNLPFAGSFWSSMSFNTDKEDELTGEDLQYVSDYEVKSGLTMGYAGFQGQLSHSLIGPQMITNYDTYLTEEKDSFDYWDLTLRYSFAEHWEVKASILNVFDQDYEWVRGYPMTERNYRVGLTYHF